MGAKLPKKNDISKQAYLVATKLKSAPILEKHIIILL